MICRIPRKGSEAKEKISNAKYQGGLRKQQAEKIAPLLAIKTDKKWEGQEDLLTCFADVEHSPCVLHFRIVDE